jgi:hypothetical protein
MINSLTTEATRRKPRKEEAEKHSLPISRELYTIKSVSSTGSVSSSTSSSELRNASDGDTPLRNPSFPRNNRLLSSLLEGHAYGGSLSTEDATDCESGSSWSGQTASDENDTSTVNAFMMITATRHDSTTDYSAVSEITNETGLTTSASKVTEATSIVADDDSFSRELSTLLEDQEEGVYQSDRSHSGDSETFITGESETYHSDGDSGGEEESFTLEGTGSYVSETYGSDESETYHSPEKTQSRDLSSCASQQSGEESEDSYSESERSESFESELTGFESTVVPENQFQDKNQHNTRRPSRKAVGEEGMSVADSTGPKPFLPSRRPPTPSSQARSNRFDSDSDSDSFETDDSESIETEESSFAYETDEQISPPNIDGPRTTRTLATESKSVYDNDSKAVSTGTKEFLPTRPLLTPIPQPGRRENSLAFLNIGALTLENVQYMSSFECASTAEDLSTVDQPISKETAASVFTKRIIPLNIPAGDMEDVSTLCEGTRNDEASEDSEDDDEQQETIKGTFTHDIEMGLVMPTLKFHGKGDETISTYASIQERSKLEIFFMIMIATSGVTLVILLGVLMTNR